MRASSRQRLGLVAPSAAGRMACLSCVAAAPPPPRAFRRLACLLWGLGVGGRWACVSGQTKRGCAVPEHCKSPATRSRSWGICGAPQEESYWLISPHKYVAAMLVSSHTRNPTGGFYKPEVVVNKTRIWQTKAPIPAKDPTGSTQHMLEPAGCVHGTAFKSACRGVRSAHSLGTALCFFSSLSVVCGRIGVRSYLLYYTHGTPPLPLNVTTALQLCLLCVRFAMDFALCKERTTGMAGCMTGSLGRWRRCPLA